LRPLLFFGQTTLLVLLICFAFNVACAETPEYPASWPSLAPQAAGCPNLTGIFQNVDRALEHRRDLASWVRPRTETPPAFIERLQFDHSQDGLITITLHKKEAGVAGVRQWQQGNDFDCDGGWLVMPQPDFIYPGFRVKITAYIARTIDGHLVIKQMEVKQWNEENGGVASLWCRHFHSIAITIEADKKIASKNYASIPELLHSVGRSAGVG
jgi:hypothetical protein